MQALLAEHQQIQRSTKSASTDEGPGGQGNEGDSSLDFDSLGQPRAVTKEVANESTGDRIIDVALSHVNEIAGVAKNSWGCKRECSLPTRRNMLGGR